MSQPQNPHWLPLSHCACGRPISAPRSVSVVRPQPDSFEGGEGESAERQVAQRVEVWRQWRPQLGCLPPQQGQEAEAPRCQCWRASGCQAAEERPPKIHQRLAAGRPALSEGGFLCGRGGAGAQEVLRGGPEGRGAHSGQRHCSAEIWT